MNYTTHSPEETRELAKRFADELQPGDILVLKGPLGSGKTCFVQGIARGLGITERYITSPTFVLIREYQGRLPLYHVDLYRLGSGIEIGMLGLDEYLNGDGVTAIEWPEKMEDGLPERTIKISIECLEEMTRKIIIQLNRKDRNIDNFTAAARRKTKTNYSI
jgi:tRNA threonylcarbamoyladenosine biosynthesis protein TsaE